MTRKEVGQFPVRRLYDHLAGSARHPFRLPQGVTGITHPSQPSPTIARAPRDQACRLLWASIPQLRRRYEGLPKNAKSGTPLKSISWSETAQSLSLHV